MAEATPVAPPAEPRPAVIDYFYEPGCAECLRIQAEILPRLQEWYEGFHVLNRYDLGIQTNYLRLVGYMEALGEARNARVFMIVDHKRMLAGFDAIAANLFALLDESISTGLVAPADEAEPPRPPPPAEVATVTRRSTAFTVGGVAMAGLVDGINPCAISTLVFLISVLSMARVQGRQLLAVGAAFCLSSFLTYTAIGFGLLHAFHALSSFVAIRKAVDALLIVLLVCLSVYSFRDAVRFRRTHRAQDVTIQIPLRVKNLIHRVMRLGLGRKAQVLSAFGIGTAVTALESVCTGQVYVPTLALVVKSGAAVGRGMGLLLLYNLMFILPLVAVLALTWQGLKLSRLMAWSVKEVFIGKLLMGGLFLAMALITLWLR